jgi:hypothetical protein
MSWRAAATIVGIGITGIVGVSCDDSPAREATTSTAAADAETVPNPTVPERQRVDTYTPAFTQPTNVTNPLFPISDLHSALLLGNDEADLLRIETTLLPEPKVVTIDGEQVNTLVSQFVEYIDGRIAEVALDWYAQDDDGAVWYFGEDVFNYEDGEVANTDGSWQAGEDGPPGMIMPADPQVGDAYRPENIPGLVFEEVVVTDVGVIVAGPRGNVDGAIIGRENHPAEGVYEDKTFAPGYGEFHSGLGGNLEALALAVPTDRVRAPVPGTLITIAERASDVFDAAQRGDWPAADSALNATRTAWDAHVRETSVPRLLAQQMDRALRALTGDALVPAVADRNSERAREAALGVLLADLDLQLQYRPPADIDRARFAVWTRRLVLDSSDAEPDVGHVAGDVATLEWIRDRIAHELDPDDRRRIDQHLDELRSAVDDEDMAGAADTGEALLETIERDQEATQ